MRHIEVEYQNDTHAFVDDYSLESLIKLKQIKKFFRPSEKRWITIGIDNVRSGKAHYCGIERRRTGRSEEMIPLRELKNCADCVSRDISKVAESGPVPGRPFRPPSSFPR